MTQSENITDLQPGAISFRSDAETQETGSASTCLHQIATRLKHLNITLQLLDQDLALYRRTVKTEIYKNNLEDIFKEKVSELKQIQKELKVYHLYNRFTLKVLCQDYCLHLDHIYNGDDEQESIKSIDPPTRTTFV